MRMLALIVALFPLTAVATPLPPSLAGAWAGTLKVGGSELHVVARIKKSGDT